MSTAFQPDAAAEGLLAEMKDSLTANSVPESDILSAEAKSAAFPYKISFQAQFGWEWKWEVYPGRQLRGDTVRNDAEAVAGIKTWAEEQIASDDILPLLMSRVKDDVPGAYKRFSGSESSIKSHVNGWSYLSHCGNCAGNGNLSCGKCSGSGGMQCYHCFGQGEQTCSRCGGSGTVGYGAQATRCGCWGGRVECWACSYGRYGRGKLQCNSCGGDGLLNCQPCNATGIVTYIYSVDITVKADGLSIKDAAQGMPSRQVALGPYANDAESIVNSAKSSKTLYKATHSVGNDGITISQKATASVRFASIATKGHASTPFEIKQLVGAGIWSPGTPVLDVALRDEMELARQSDPIAALNAARRTRVGRALLANAVGSTESPDPALKFLQDKKYTSSAFNTEWQSLLEAAYIKIPEKILNKLWIYVSAPLCLVLFSMGYLQLFFDELTHSFGESPEMVMAMYAAMAAILIFVNSYIISGLAFADMRRHIPEARRRPPLNNIAKIVMGAAFLSHILGLWLGY